MQLQCDNNFELYFVNFRITALLPSYGMILLTLTAVVSDRESSGE